VREAEHELARADRQQRRDGDGECARRRERSQTSNARTHNNHEQDPDCDDRDPDNRFNSHVPSARQEKRRQDVPVEPRLIRGERQDHERCPDACHGDLSDQARPGALGHAHVAASTQGLVHDRMIM
jgi:hypothetical protein